jgi:hypothetical protein
MSGNRPGSNARDDPLGPIPPLPGEDGYDEARLDEYLSHHEPAWRNAPTRQTLAEQLREIAHRHDPVIG